MAHQGDTYGRKGKEGDADQGKGGCDQAALPCFGRLVSVADGGQRDLKGEEAGRGAAQGQGDRGAPTELPPPRPVLTRVLWH